MNEFMQFFVDNWYLIIAAAAVIIIVGLGVYTFFKQPTNEQIKNIKKWLLLAVVEAEKELGSGTGQLKLRKVYDMAIARFPWVAFISFEVFSEWVDEALEIMREQLDQNKAIAMYVLGNAEQ